MVRFVLVVMALIMGGQGPWVGFVLRLVVQLGFRLVFGLVFWAGLGFRPGNFSETTGVGFCQFVIVVMFAFL